MPTAHAVPALRPFRYLRQVLPWLLALATVTCAQDQLEPSRGGVGYFSFRPVYALAGGAHLSQFGIVADSVHIRLTRPVNQLVLDTTVFFPSDSAQLSLALPVELEQSPESLTAAIEISALGIVIFSDTVGVEAKQGPPGSSTPPTVTFKYVGPGTTIGSLQLVPGDTTIVLKDTLFFAALAFDSSAVPVASFYVGWKTTDTTVAKINAGGRLIAPALRGTVGVVGMTPTGIADTTFVTFAPVPVIITADSGNGQTGLVTDSIASLFVAQVKGADSLGIPGIEVRFSAVTAGGAVRDTLVLTDAQGRARTRGVLGLGAATYTYSATVVALPALTTNFTTIATAAAPSTLAIISGNPQVDTAGDVLPAPLVVRVTDAFNNPVVGALVVFADLAGPASPDTVATVANGIASAPFTLRPLVGIDSVQVSLLGTGASVLFTITGIPGGPATVAIDSGNAQSVGPAIAFTDSLVARVLDGHGNAVPAAKVAWVITTGTGVLSADTTLTAADGRARVGVTAGTTAGALHVQGSAAGAGSTAQFALTVVPGAPSAFLAVGGDTQSTVPGGVLAQPVVVAVRDAFGNGIPGKSVNFTVIAGLGTVDSSTATTDAAGLANSGHWTLGPVAGTNQVRVTTGVLGADTLLFTAIGLPIGTTKQWTAAIDNIWSTAGNWSPVGAPSPGDNVFIPAAVASPTVNADANIGGLQIESGATVTITTVNLGVSGNALISGAVAGGGNLLLTGSGVTLAGTLLGPGLAVDGTVSLTGPLSSTGTIAINAGTLTPAGHPIAANGGMNVAGTTGHLVMTNAADSVDVSGAFQVTTNASSAADYTNGVLVLRGNFTQPSGAVDNFSASGSHKTRFAGSAAQTVSFATPGIGASGFRDVEFANAGGITLGANGFAATGLTQVSAGTVAGAGSIAQLAGDLQATYANWHVSQTFFHAAPTVYPDSLSGNVTLLAPWTLTKSFSVDSVLLISTGGVLDAGGHRLTAGNIVQADRLVMHSPADTVDAKESLVVTSALSGAGDLTDGLLIVRALMSQSGAAASFRPSGAHRTLLTSATGITVNFASGASGFHHVTFDAAGGTAMAGNLTVTGNILAQAGLVSDADTVTLSGDSLIRVPGAQWGVIATDVQTHLPTLPDSIGGSLILRDTVSLSTPLAVFVDLRLDGGAATLLANQHRITVNGGLTVQNGGLLRMAAGDTVDVTGNATFTGRATNGALTGGLLDLHGSLFDLNDSGFVADPAHVTRINGPVPATLFFAAPAAGHGEFGVLDLTNAIGGITLATDVRVSGMLAKAAGTTVNVAGGGHVVTVDGDLAVDDMIFDQARLVARDADNVATFDNVTFADQDPAATQFSFTAPGGTDTLKFHNINFVTVPTSGRYIRLADSTANGLPVQVGFYNSTPLNGATFELTDAVAGDAAKVLWSRLVWQVQPDSVTAGGLFPLAPKVAAVDPDSALLTSYTGTITVAFAVDPTGGLAVLTGNSLAAVNGVATFDSLRVSVPAPGFLFQASSPELGTSAPSGSFIVLAPIPPGITTAFTNGAGDNDWFNATNWTAGVPDSQDNVFVYPGTAASINAPARVNRLVVGNGGTLTLNATLSVDSSVDAGHTVLGSGTLLVQGTGTLRGQVGDLLVFGHYVVPTGDTLSAQSLTVGGSGVLDVGGGRIDVTADLSTLASGALSMADPAGRVNVGGNVSLAGEINNFLNGTLTIGGDLTAAGPGSEGFTPGFLTIFHGVGHPQTVQVPGTDSVNGLGGVTMVGDSVIIVGTTWISGTFSVDSGVATVDTVNAMQGVGGTAAGILRGNILSIAGTLTFPGAYAVGTTVFAGGGQTIPVLSAPYDSVWVSGTAQLGSTIDAQLFYVVGGGQFDLNGHRLNVAGDFGTAGSGVFSMQSPSDSLFVGGSGYFFGGATTGLLTRGLVQIAGSFFQGGTPLQAEQQVEFAGPPPAFDGFHADTGLVTRFVGGAPPRVIYFSSPLQPPGSGSFSAGPSSQFGALEIIDGSDTLSSIVPVAGTTAVGTAEVTGPGTLAAIGPLTVAPSAVGMNVASLYTGGGLDYQPAPATYNVPETFFFGGTSIPILPYQWLRVGFTSIPLTGDLNVQQVTLGGQGEGSVDSYNGELDLNGHALTTSGDFTLTGFGKVKMTSPADSLDVGGSFNASGGSTSGLVTDGVIVARGAVYVTPNWEDSSFIATGANRFRMAAAGTVDLGIVQGTNAANRFSKFTIGAGTTANFNQYQNGTLIATDSLSVAGFLTQASAGQKLLALGDLYVGTSAGITVDTVELHQGLDVDLSTYSTQLTRYAGVSQIVSATANYHDLEVTGTAALDSTVTVTNDASIHGAGVLTMAGHALEVSHDLTVADSGLLVMTSPADSLNVGYTATFDGRDSEGWLTAGTLTFNYFKQLASTSPKAFRATGAHRAVLLQQNPADATEMVQFATPGATASQFQEFELSGGSLYAYFGAGTIYVADSLYVPAGGSSGLFGSGTTMTVNGPIAVQTGTIPIQFDTLELRGTIQVPYSSLGNGVTRFAGVNQQIPDTQNYQRIEVTGSATLETGGGDLVASDVAITGNGHLTLGALDQVTTNGPFTTSGNGTLTMNDPTGILFVNGTATFSGGSTAGKLSAGTMKVTGDLVQTTATSDSAFHPGVGFLTQFTGARHHIVSFASADLNFGSNFGTLEVTANDTLDINGGHPAVFGRTTLDGTAVLLDAPRTGTFNALGTFEAGSFAQIHLFELAPRDTFLIDPTAGYDATYTHFAYYALPVPALAYTNIIFENGSPSLGANVFATGFVTVNGTQFTGGSGVPMTLTFDGHSLTSSGFSTGSFGAIAMDQPGDSLIVNGPAAFQGQSELGKLTAGTIRFGGDLSTDTVSGGARSAFVTEGSLVEFDASVPHDLHFFDADSSYLPPLNSSDPAPLQLHITGRARIAGGLDGYGLELTGDTLITDGQLSAGPAGLSVNLRRYEGPVFYQFQNVNNWTVTTTQFTGDGGLPFSNNFAFDTLIVSANVQGQLSQLLTANYVEVTGPGNPRHIGGSVGVLGLSGGDGNTTVNVTGNVLVSGAGATIHNNWGTLTTSGDLTVQQGGLLVATASGCCGQSLFDIGGNATFTGASTKDSLTSGLLLVGGNFTQGGPDFESFVADSDFVTKFQNAGTHVITFATPTSAGGNGSHFGSLELGNAAGIVLQTAGPVWVEGSLIDTTFSSPTLQGTSGGVGPLTVRDVNVQGITFDHLQLHLQKNSAPHFGFAAMGNVTFANFAPSDTQFVVDLPGAPTQFNWGTFTFAQLTTGDAGRYVVATDTDGGSPDVLTISLGTNNFFVADVPFYVALGGAVLTPFSP